MGVYPLLVEEFPRERPLSRFLPEIEKRSDRSCKSCQTQFKQDQQEMSFAFPYEEQGGLLLKQANAHGLRKIRILTFPELGRVR
jgi:hypothetical protein